MLQQRLAYFIAFALVAASPSAQAQKFTNSCSAPQFPSATPTGIDDLCGVSGTLGSPEASQNEAKNNFCAAGPPRPITIANMVDFQKQVQKDRTINFGNQDTHPFSSTPGPAKNREPLKALGEGNEVVLQGYVLIARQEGAESVNCGKTVPDNPTDHDIHISIVDSPSNKVECSGVVAEMSPHHRPSAWTQEIVEAIAKAHLLVRLTGQLFFDSSHSPCSGAVGIQGDPKRASLWEIHPIYKFDVCTLADCGSGGWVSLAEWKPNRTVASLKKAPR